jgi:hypothetical protein
VPTHQKKLSCHTRIKKNLRVSTDPATTKNHARTEENRRYNHALQPRESLVSKKYSPETKTMPRGCSPTQPQPKNTP